MRTFFFICCFLNVLTSSAQKQLPVALIPEPVKWVRTTGVFVLPKNVTVAMPAGDSSAALLRHLNERIGKSTGYTAVASNNGVINFQLAKPAVSVLGREGYQLSVKPSGVSIRANSHAGLFYGLQSLLQLFPAAIESTGLQAGVQWQAPAVDVTDYPRFGWRGLMLDVSRHFFTVAEVKRYIDDMVRYKYNLLHLGLTNDEGWRIEIKSLPRLTEVGAWRVNKTGYFGYFSKPEPGEPRDYGGFYTQEDIKELVRYAAERFINILPEINVPAHGLAAIASYPELSCTPEATTYVVRSGEQIMDWSRGAPPTALVDNTLCPANEKAYEFVDKVLSEVAPLFPFEFIHMGGDEAPHNFWEKNPQILELMKRENLKSMEAVQGYFTKRIEKLVQSKGKKMIGWDEIMEGNINTSTAIMSWRGVKGGIEAAQKGHQVVMSPTTYAYIDYMQADSAVEPRVYAALRLNKSYEFDPAPDGVNAAFIKGGQANLWTEQIYNLRTAQYMTWPRAMAIAESVWSPKAQKNWPKFFSRAEQHFNRLSAAQTKWAPAVYDPIINVKREGVAVVVQLDKEFDGVDFYYTVDNSFPDAFSAKYTTPVVMPKDAAMLRVIGYRNGQPAGRLHTLTMQQLLQRIKK